MKSSVEFKDYNSIQKIGFILLIIASVITLVGFLNIFEVGHFIKEDLRVYSFLIGGLLILLPSTSKKIKGNGASTKTSIILIVLCTSFGALAQDYTNQINAFAQSFADKNTEALQPYMSGELHFGKIPKANTSAIMENIVNNLPKLNHISIVESENGMAKVAYDFVGLGKRTSDIHFDAEGKIMKIELVENLIKMQAEAQRQQQNSVQQPNPGELANKYIPTKVEFPAPDGLTISGNLYEIGRNKPVILLMHQAGYNLMEYADIAPKLNDMGYNCLAVDLRSGGSFAGKPNNSYTRALERGLKPEMADAQQDIRSAIDFLLKKYNQKVIVWGSSYSSSLALLEGADNSEVKAIISFSPGDYFGDALPSLATVFTKIEIPYLVTSSKAEAEALTTLIGGSKNKKNQSQFIPESSGFHGSRVLWEGQEGAEEYWTAITEFLKSISTD